MTNYNTHLIQPNVSAGVRHKYRGLAVAVIASFGPIQRELEAKRTLTRKGAGSTPKII